MDYNSYYSQQLHMGSYREHMAGDLHSFRYPHLCAFETEFSFQKERLYWRFRSPDREEDAAGLLRRIAAEDITVYEFLAPAAAKIHLKDMTGETGSEAERRQAFEQVCALYENREREFPSVRIQKTSLRELPVREGFEAVAALYEDLADVPVWMVCLEHSGRLPFPYGSMLKGTDLVFTDENAFNFGQDFLHALYHLQEGIPGIGGDNLYVQEWWAPVPALYAMQLAKGRMGRRIRLRPSPHPIHFTDYIYLRAFLGQAFVPEENDAPAHPVYGIIEPSIRLVMYALKQSGRADAFGDRIRILADAVLADRTEELTACFETVFGEGSFSAIYDTYGIYEKYERASRFVQPKLLDGIMFENLTGDGSLSDPSYPVDTERIWKDPAYRKTCIQAICEGSNLR